MDNDNQYLYIDYRLRIAIGQIEYVRCPGHTIHFMGYGYENYKERLIELAGIYQPEDWKPYDFWSP